jgi:hypothetical protein
VTAREAMSYSPDTEYEMLELAMPAMRASLPLSQQQAAGGMQMRVFRAAAVVALLVVPAHAQSQSVPKYGETAKTKSPQEIEAEKEADRAYQKSLGNIPNQAPTDPWGNVRTESPPKPVAKTSSVKRTKPSNPAN